MGAQYVLGGLCGIISFIAEPGHIRHIGIEPFIQFGELDNQPSERAERLRQVFARAKGLTVEIPPDIHAPMGRKFLRITSWAGIGAITRSPVGTFSSQPETREMLKQAMHEIWAVAQAHNSAIGRLDNIQHTL